MARIIGIDLGTTTSEVAYMDGDKATIILNIQENNSSVIPSVVYIGEDEVKVGQTAKNQAILKASSTVCEVKRKMGSGEKIKIKNKEYLPEEISAKILKKIKEVAEFSLGESVDSAVITVPANFSEIARRATRDAGEIAGLKVERIINEPTAAAMAYGLNNLNREGYILVYDLGGGTLDVSVLELFNGILDVKASRGNNFLGGKDIDEILIKYIVEKFKQISGITLNLSEARVFSTLKNAAEEAKKNLSSDTSTDVIIPYITLDSEKNAIDLDLTITRKEFEEKIKALIDSTQKTITETLTAAKITDKDVTAVILVGGSTRIPYVRESIDSRFRGKLVSGVNPDETVALGAAVQSAIVAGSMSKEKGIIVTDACSYNLGVEVLNGEFDIIIKRDSKLPINITKGYHTVSDNQDVVDIRVYEGVSNLVKENNFIGSFELSNIPLAPRAKEQIDITFSYDLNGILNVDARIKSTGQVASKKMEIVGLSRDKINELKKELNNNENNAEVQKNNIENNEKNSTTEVKSYSVQETYDKTEGKTNIKEQPKEVNTVKPETEESDEKLSTPEELYQYVGQLVKYYNSVANSLDENTKKVAGEKLQNLLAAVKAQDIKTGENLCHEVLQLIYKQ